MFRISIVLLFFLNSLLFAKECAMVLDKYPDLKKDGWSFRIDDKIDEFGCDIIPLYSFLKKSDSVFLMDVMDEDTDNIKEIMKLFKNKKVFNIMLKNKSIKEILLNNAGNTDLLHNVNYLFEKHFNSAIRKKIIKNPIYLNYYILAAANASSTNQLLNYYKRLRELSIEGIEVFSFVYASLGDDYKFSYLMENFFTLKRELSKNQLREIAQYPSYLAYFLYPTAEDMKLYGDDIYEQKKQFQKLMITIYKSTYDHLQYTVEDENVIALLTMENIYPYIVENRNYYELGMLFEALAQKGYIDEMWSRTQNICNKKSVQEVFALFGDNNLNNLLKLQKNENSMYYTLIGSNSNNRSIFSLFYISNVYAKFNNQKWFIFKDLLNSFSYDKYENVLILKELDKIGYFDQVVKVSDHNAYVRVNEDDRSGKSSRKYKFILLTSYPSDNDYSAYYYLASGHPQDAKKTLAELYHKSITDLEIHNFTSFEKNMATLETVENTLTVAAIVAAPFTGGVSLGYVAAKKAGKVAAKKGIKFYAKKIALKSRKLLNKGISVARKGRKTIYKSIGEKNTRIIGKNLDKLDNTVTVLAAGAALGGAVFLATPTNMEAKNICEKKK